MKILHNGQMIGGLGVYIQNSIIYNKVESNEYVIVCGRDDNILFFLSFGKKGNNKNEIKI